MSKFLKDLTFAFICFFAPFEFKNFLDISTIFFPFQNIVNFDSFFIVATLTACKFSSLAKLKNFSISFLSITTAILSCDSDIASSVPSSPSYFFNIALRFISIPSESSPIATETPPAPKSLHFFISFETFGFLKSL